MIGGRRPLQGRKPGDRRVRVERPHAPYFRYTGEGTLTAKEAASVPTTPGARMVHKARTFVLGRPLSNVEEAGERLSKKKALAIFSSDAISSSAYATEEILRAFLLAGAALAAFTFAVPVSIAIAILLAVVAFSYRQVCIAYPTGGGSYSVSKENFGRLASLVAASALLIDYNLTVAVSTSSAVEQVVSAIPSLAPLSVVIGVAAIGLITVGNLRGLREAGNIFAVPTYLFIGSALLMIGMGAYRIVVLGETGAPSQAAIDAASQTTQAVGALVLLRAFASGAVALTGTEAIATGVPAFKPPEPKNAATTLMFMAGILAVLFIGITFLATNFGILPIDEPVKQTVI
jgi:amino acid transporter